MRRLAKDAQMQTVTVMQTLTTHSQTIQPNTLTLTAMATAIITSSLTRRLRTSITPVCSSSFEIKVEMHSPTLRVNGQMLTETGGATTSAVSTALTTSRFKSRSGMTLMVMASEITHFTLLPEVKRMRLQSLPSNPMSAQKSQEHQPSMSSVALIPIRMEYLI